MVYILLADGFEEAEALVPADLLRRAGIETALVSLEGEWAVGGRGMAVRTDLTLPQVDLTRAEMIVLPGGRTRASTAGSRPRPWSRRRWTGGCGWPPSAPPPPCWPGGAS